MPEIAAGTLGRTASLVSGDPGVSAGLVFASTEEVIDHRGKPTGVLAGVLADNGGPTWTIALKDDPSNPALDRGSALDAPASDQRGVLRPMGFGPDIGAFELVAPPGAVDNVAVAGRARPVVIDVLGNDGDGGSPPLLLTGLGAPSGQGLVVTLADQRLLYVPDPGFAGVSSFSYEVTNGRGLGDAAQVDVVVADFAGLPMSGGPGDDMLEGGDADEIAFGNAGDDVIRGRAGNDVLWGGEGDDRLLGGAGDDILIGGSGNDLLQGLGRADLYVLASLEGRADIRGFSLAEGDRVVVAIAELLLADSSLDGARVRGIVRGNGLAIQADADGDGTFADLGIVRAGAGLALDDVLANAIHLA